jgi:hypothetical protein
MSEPDKPKDPRAPKAGGFPSAPDERDLDNALAAAADLAAGLAKEVREAQPPMPRTSAKDERLALDQELAELERLTDKAAEDLGAAEPGTKRKKKRPVSAIPDFMSELTGPAPEASSRTQESVPAADAADTVTGELVLDPNSAAERGAAVDSTETQPQPAVQPPVARVGSIAAGCANAEGLAPIEQAADAGSSAQAKAQDEAPDSTKVNAGVVGNIANPRGKGEMLDAREAHVAAAEAVIEASPGALEKSLYAAAERLAPVLEIMDRPFGRLSQPVKQVIGWFAVATILTSVIVAVAAFLS